MFAADYGQNIIHNDGTIVKVHHVSPEGKVYYYAFWIKSTNHFQFGETPYDREYGFITDFEPLSREDSLEFERVIINNS